MSEHQDIPAAEPSLADRPALESADSGGARARKIHKATHPLTLFYSYAHKDERFRDALATHLALLRREGLLEEWYDRDIDGGEDWRQAINQHLEAANIILLLVSADFIASDYCWGIETARALERHREGTARVIPIVVRPTNWESTPFKGLQAFPKNARPVSLWPNRDMAWMDVARGIREVVNQLARAPRDATAEGARMGARRTVREAHQEAQAAPAAKPDAARSTEDQGKQARERLSRAARPSSGARSERIMQRPARRAGAHPRRLIFSAGNREDVPGNVVRREGDPPTGDVAVDETYEALGAVYTFFWDVFERDSSDGRGAEIRSTVHYANSFNNAFWNGTQIVIGDGDGEMFLGFTSVDIIAKEFMNAVLGTDTSLPYWHESGTVHEAIGAVFASLVRQYVLGQRAVEADWLIGAESLGPKSPGRGLRTLAEPGTAYDNAMLGKDPQPAHMKGFVKTDEDNGGVHLNSGILCRAFYLSAVALGGYAWERAGRIWYETLRSGELGDKTNFRSFAQLTFVTAQRLYGRTSDEAAVVQFGWKMVGLEVPGPTGRSRGPSASVKRRRGSPPAPD
ncbi:M4 family metallopeptidase [Pyxidicoccus parkwayensis]|uniref:Neutral metalloproteinase n=1 Tax=Pyxidicoccus parkwayensis TaxID=2813578 RepID=A0ABX7P5D6_9BACT|nr:M4 family metallopeptidase [Pyxidicoccus parkwaysis]QSQ25699.1 M4 family metallopeptidase [Pyxidicoccus parkwaysis]